VINSVPAQELVYEKIEDKDLALYIDGLAQLDRFGVDFMVMVCNTIHLFYDKLQAGVKTPILDLRKEVGAAIDSNGAKSVLVLGTHNTLDKGLYGSSFVNAKPVKPTKAETKVLAEAIFNFNNGTDKEGQIRKVRAICESYLGSGKADSVLLGCTEFGLMLDDVKFPKINTLDVLVDATIKRLQKK
jgi:aspartate racemase